MNDQSGSCDKYLKLTSDHVNESSLTCGIYDIYFPFTAAI